jgi:hypothetical protein
MSRWWWVVRPRCIAADWSPEERRTLWLIHLIAMPLFGMSCYETVMTLFSMDLDPLLIAIVGVVPPCVASFYVARRLSEWLFPDMVKRADENAARRIASEQAAEWRG